jgi:hypothetical protein
MSEYFFVLLISNRIKILFYSFFSPNLAISGFFPNLNIFSGYFPFWIFFLDTPHFLCNLSVYVRLLLKVHKREKFFGSDFEFFIIL